MSMISSSLFAGPDRRYWRRRANRRVRKARLTRSLSRWGLILAVDSLIAVSLLLAGRDVIERVLASPAFALARVEVGGVHHADAARIAELLAPLRGTSLLALRLDEVVLRVSRDPWVRSATAKRLLPGTVRIEVTERLPAAVARIDGVPHVVDTEGHVIGPASEGQLARFPLLVGLTRADEPALIGALHTGVTLVAELRERSGAWVDGVAEIDLAPADHVALRTRDPGPELWLDARHGPRNVATYLELRHEIERRAGALARVDLRWRDRITVVPLPNPTTPES